MNIEASKEKVDEFAAVLEYVEECIGEMRSATVKAMEHVDVEVFVGERGKEFQRRMFQSFLNEKAAEEKKVEHVKGEDGEERKECRRNCERKLMSLHGEVEVKRCGYSGKGLSSVFPLDKKLNLPQVYYSHGLQRLLGREVVRGSFEEACDAIQRSSGGEIPKRQAEECVRQMSQDFEAYQTQCIDEVEANDTILVMSCDAKGIVMRHEDLLKATKRAAERENHKLKTRLSRGEKGYRKRMAVVAAIYGIKAEPRRAEEVLKACEDKKKHPRGQNKRMWATLKHGTEAVVEELVREALKRDPDKKKQWLLLVDGQEGQLRAIEKVLKRRQVPVVIIQDFVHVLEYIWKAAYCFHSEGTQAAEEWVKKRALGILQGEVSEMAAGMRRSATRQELCPEKRKAVDKCANYLLKNKKRLDYATALKQGWPIATGVIEGACRYLVKDRMDLTGARWSLTGAEAVLQLRALHVNGRLDEYMRFHEQQELFRNYSMVA